MAQMTQIKDEKEVNFARLSFVAPANIQFRHNFFLVTKEAVTNVVRHAAATEVRLTIDIQGDIVAVTLSDNGQGFVAEPDLGSNGLLNMRARMEEIGGDWQIQSGRGSGTHLSYRFPWKPGRRKR